VQKLILKVITRKGNSILPNTQWGPQTLNLNGSLLAIYTIQSGRQVATFRRQIYFYWRWHYSGVLVYFRTKVDGVTSPKSIRLIFTILRGSSLKCSFLDEKSEVRKRRVLYVNLQICLLLKKLIFAYMKKKILFFSDTKPLFLRTQE